MNISLNWMTAFAFATSVGIGSISHAQNSLDQYPPHLKFSGIATSNGQAQQISLVDSGIGALEKRLEMVSDAKKTIDVQYYIYHVDRAGRLFTQALIRKAHEGVKIRMLIDTSAFEFRLNNIFIDQIIRAGGVDPEGRPMIQVRYYNLDSVVDLFNQNFRAHRKLVVVDNEIAVTGGRNIADEYFGLSPNYNFLDTDIFVKGSIVKNLTVDFEDFWNSPLASIPKPPEEPSRPSSHRDTSDYDARMALIEKYHQDIIAAEDFTVQNEKDIQLLQLIQINGRKALKMSFQGDCHDMVYMADHPGTGRFQGTRVVWKALENEIQKETALFRKPNDFAVPNEIMIETPYFIPTEEVKNWMTDKTQSKIKVTILTNSLKSSDEAFTVASSDRRILPILFAGVHVSVYDGSSAPNLFSAEPESEHADWGIHSKRAVAGNEIMVGTFNIDPRSDYINAEMAFVCRDNKAAALFVKHSIDSRLLHSVELDSDGQPKDGRPLSFGAGFLKTFRYWLSFPFASLFSFLM